MLRSISIKGLRGFAEEQTLELAVPDGENAGSGLTVIVGPNGGGKSTLVEAFRAMSQNEAPSFAQGRRNVAAGDNVRLRLAGEAYESVVIESVVPGTSEAKRVVAPEGSRLGREGLFVLPSRRFFSPFFGKGLVKRPGYMQQVGFPALRSSTIDQFSARLFEIQDNRVDFDEVMRKVIDPVPEWTIDQHDRGEYFLKVKKGDATHSSEGLGEGIVSLIFIIDALYDSQPGQTVVIDEPELSLHPSLQRKLATLFAEYAKDRQIIISTHSTYFTNLRAPAHGGVIARVHNQDNVTRISKMSTGTGESLANFLNDSHNPHVLGINAQEAFFLEDNIVLVEGQEDVIYLQRVETSLREHIKGNMFGWGVGGAEKMKLITQLLKELGFKKVVGILDANKIELSKRLQAEFGEYHFAAIPANDIRTKPAFEAKSSVRGLLDEGNTEVRDEYRKDATDVIQAANLYLGRTEP